MNCSFQGRKNRLLLVTQVFFCAVVTAGASVSVGCRCVKKQSISLHRVTLHVSLTSFLAGCVALGSAIKEKGGGRGGVRSSGQNGTRQILC